MRLGVAYLIAVVLSVLALAPAAAQLLGLPGRMALVASDYVFVQQVLHSWSWAWILLPASFVADVALLLMYRQRGAFKLVSVAALLMACTMLVFFVWIYPVDRATESWTLMPANWTSLREQWEYAQAANALLTFLAFMSLMLAAPVIYHPRRAPNPRTGYSADILYVQ